MEHQVIRNESTGLETVLAFFPNEEEALVSATSDHPHYTSIVRGLKANDETVYGLFNVANTASRKLADLGSRYSIRHGRLCRDLDPVENALADQVVRFIDEGVEDWKPLVAFLEKVDANPREESRNDLVKWIAAGKLTLTEDGNVVGYKCVAVTDKGHTSVANGPAVVDGKDVNGFVPQTPGSIVEMARSQVDSNNRVECSVGLHVGTFDYATWFSKQVGGWKNPSDQRAIMEVEFNPMDAVAVPPDFNHSKVRVCRYKVRGLKDSPYTSIVRPMEDFYTSSQVEEYHDDVDAPDGW